MYKCGNIDKVGYVLGSVDLVTSHYHGMFLGSQSAPKCQTLVLSPQTNARHHGGFTLNVISHATACVSLMIWLVLYDQQSMTTDLRSWCWHVVSPINP